MSKPLNDPSPIRESELNEIIARLESLPAPERIGWALERFRPKIHLLSTFGAESAVVLHMATHQWPEIPVVLVDTGYLFPETYQFIDQLVDKLNLNLKIYRPELTSAWLEARYGRLWEQGAEGLQRYNQIHKIEPMQRAMRELDACARITGLRLRREHGNTRAGLRALTLQEGLLKVHPLLEWTDRQIQRYMEKHNLPDHPLCHQGYTAIGDVYTTRLPAGAAEKREGHDAVSPGVQNATSESASWADL